MERLPRLLGCAPIVITCPWKKQRELWSVAPPVFEEFDDAYVLARHEWTTVARIHKANPMGATCAGHGRPAAIWRS